MLGLGLGLGSIGQSLQQRAMGILRSFGSNAHSYPFSTLQGAYQTSAGPAAAAVNDPVGLELDALGTLGPNLVTNGDFSAGATGWTGDANITTAINGGVFNLGAVTTGNTLTQPCLIVGKMYKLVFSVTRFSVLGNFRVRIGGGVWGDLILAISTVGTYTIYGQATVDTELAFVRYATSDFDIDNVSVQEVTGNHATQTTAINRPTVQQDGGGRWYASFNGTNQSMQLASTLTAVAGTFICCARADVLHFGTLFGGGGNYVSEPGISLITANNGSLRAVFGNGTITNQSVSAVDTYTPGEIFVVSVQWDMSFIKIRKNSGTTRQVANLLGDLTSATLGSIGRIGPLGGTYFSGSIYDLDAIKGTVTDAQLLTLEKAAGQRAGLVI